MFERFSSEARDVVVHAQDEARRLGHNYLGTEHLLLGILRLPGDGTAPGALDRLGVTLLDAREQVARIVGRGEDRDATGQIPFTERAKSALENALHEAQALGHRAIGPEHVLLGLVGQAEGVANRVLLDFDARPERVRRQVLDSPAPELPPTAEPVAGLSALPAVATQEPAARPSRRAGGTLAAVALGWFGFGAAVGIGLLLGRLIWG